jgi:Glycosyl transferase family 2
MTDLNDHPDVLAIAGTKLSVVMPVYNERNTLRIVVERVLTAPMEIELLCVDDGSSTGSSIPPTSQYGQGSRAAPRHPRGDR